MLVRGARGDAGQFPVRGDTEAGIEEEEEALQRRVKADETVGLHAKQPQKNRNEG
jgi:hypothetical protein